MTQSYPKARNLIATSCFLYLLLRYSSFGVDFKIPFLNIKLPQTNESLLVIVLLICYFLARLLIEWFSAEKVLRERTSSKIDFSITLLLGLTPIVLTVYDKTKDDIVSYPNAILTVIILLALGEFVAVTTDFQLTSIRFIRSKEEAAYKILPRIPVAIKCMYPYTMINIAIIYFLYKYAPSYVARPLEQVWFHIFLLPLLIHLPHIVLDAFDRKSKTFVDLKDCFEMYDSNFQEEDKCCEISPLFNAAKTGKIHEVKAELENGANPDEKNARGWTPFMISVANGHLHCVRLLIEYGANVNHTNGLGRTALMFASRHGHLKIVKLLLQNGAIIENQTIEEAKTALMVASEHGHLEIVESLLVADANPELRDGVNMSAIDYAEKGKHGELCKILRRNKKDC